MSTATVSNASPPRKQLSAEIDRLDAILDGLSDALNVAVADAAREGTRLALKDAVIEIMTDSALRAKLHQATAPEPAYDLARPTKQPGFWARLKARAVRTASAVGQTACNAARRMAEVVQGVAAKTVQTVRSLGRFSGLKRLAMVGLATGMAIATAPVFAPRAVASALSAASRAVAAIAVQAGRCTRRAVRALALL